MTTHLTTLLLLACSSFAASAQVVRVTTRDGHVAEYTNVERIDFVTADDTPDPARYVDLGLPSGTLWATCNIGANAPEDFGDFFAWGETQPKTSYTVENYTLCSGQVDMLTKYNDRDDSGPVDNLRELLPEDDAATVLWGEHWQTPSEAQYRELISKDNTTMALGLSNGTAVLTVTSLRNGNVLVFPASGNKYYDNHAYQGSHGDYWTRDLMENEPWNATKFTYYDGAVACLKCYRYYGLPIRPVLR